MSKKVLWTITAGNVPFYEIIDLDRKTGTVGLSLANQHDKYFEIEASSLDKLGNALKKVYREYYEQT